MRTVADLPVPSIPWRGIAAFVLDNVVPVLGLAAIVVGAFQLPGAWGAVGGWIVAGAAALYAHNQFADEIGELKQQARADRIDRARARADAARLKAVA